jgi:hypothetical protein
MPNLIKKKLKIINHPVFFSGHRHAGPFRELVATGKMEVISSSEYDAWSKDLPFSDPQSTCTFQECIDICVTTSGDVNITVWNGNAYGDQTTKKAIYTLIGWWWEHKAAVDAINRAFCSYTLSILEEERLAEQEKLRLIIENRLLSE